jgi:hypothetical protein
MVITNVCAMTKIVGIAKPFGVSGPTGYRMLRVIGMQKLYTVSRQKMTMRLWPKHIFDNPCTHSVKVL